MPEHTPTNSTGWTMDEKADFFLERTPFEINTVKQCASCGHWEMLIRDPRHLNDGNVFAYCPACGSTFHVRYVG